MSIQPRLNRQDSPDLGDGSGRPDAQVALIVPLADRHAVRAQQGVGGDGVEMDVRQDEGEDERPGREGEVARPRKPLIARIVCRKVGTLRS